jgi:hypothetical protein
MKEVMHGRKTTRLARNQLLIIFIPRIIIVAKGEREASVSLKNLSPFPKLSLT